MSKDRFSIHQESGGPLIQEAFTIMRDGGTTASSGLVGITNRGYEEGGDPFLPETIFNTQASGDSFVRFSSGPSGIYNARSTSAVSILGNGNTRASGIQVTYFPDCDNASLEPCPDGDCGGGNNPTYRRYRLDPCDGSDPIFVYDNLGVVPNILDVVSYRDNQGNEGCATVHSYTTTSNSDSSQIVTNYGVNACSVCEGDTPDNTTVYETTLCGGSEIVLLSNTVNYDLTGGPVVKFQYLGQTTCGTVNPTPIFGSPVSNINGIVDDCSDPECGVPAGTIRYRVSDCDDPNQKYLVDDNSGNTYQINVDRVIVTIGFEQTICALIEEQTADSGPEMIISDTLGEAFSDCTCSSTPITRWWFECCDAPYESFAWNVFNVLGIANLQDGDEVVAQWWDVNGDKGPQWPQNGTQLNGVIRCLALDPADCPQEDNYQPFMDLLPIISDQGDCQSGPPTDIYTKYTIDPCDVVRNLEYVTSTTDVANGKVVIYDNGDGIDRCGTIIGKAINQPEIPNTSIGNVFDECIPCEASIGNNQYVYGFSAFTYLPPCDGVGDVPCDDCCDRGIPYIVNAPDCDHNTLMNSSINWHTVTLNNGNTVTGYICTAYLETPAGYSIEGQIDCPPSPMINTYSSDPNWINCFNPCEVQGLPIGGGGVGGCALLPAGDENPLNGPPGGGAGGGAGGGFGYKFGSGGANEGGYVINTNGDDQVVADLALVRASGLEGFDMGHLSFSERGYVGIGLTRTNKTTKFIPNAPLTINYAAQGHRDSGTISIREQSESPNYNGNYGKIYVKSFTGLGGSQALFFKDDTGLETNLLVSSELPEQGCCDLIADYEGPSGMVFGDVYGNTYAGWHTPESRVSSAGTTRNTLFGWAAGYDMSNGSPDFNTLIGYTAGSGATVLQRNTVVGSESLVKYGAATANVIIGYGNVKTAMAVPAEDDSLPTSGIIIGNELFVNSDPPTGILAIGHGLTPVVTGQTTGNSRSFAVDDATFIVSTGNSIYSISSDFAGGKYTTLVDVRDEDSTGTTLKNNIKFNFSNSDDYTKTLLEINPYAAERTNTPTYASQGFQYTELDSDLRIRGAIRFQDGSSLSGVAEWFELGLRATSGVNQVTETNGYWSVLDYSELELATSVSNDIRVDNTFVSVQLDGTASSNMGKMDLSELAGYLSDSFVNISDNCNVIITDPINEQNLDPTANSESVFMGCNVATNASGWKNSVIIGTEAGQDAVTPNPTLATSTAAVFIGYRAGYDSDNIDNTVFIGTSAGRDADAATDSIFIGGSAGLATSYNNSIGIGQNALRGAGIGAGNIEIVANKLDNQRLLYNAGDVDNKLNIQNTIAGDTSSRNLSIGDARLSPEAPLEVRRDTTIHGGNPNNYIQSWHCDDSVVAAIDCDGSVSGFIVEGVLMDGFGAANDITDTTETATLSVYENGVITGQTVTVVNRSSNMSHSAGDYMIAVKIAGEYRPLSAKH